MLDVEQVVAMRERMGIILDGAYPPDIDTDLGMGQLTGMLERKMKLGKGSLKDDAEQIRQVWRECEGGGEETDEDGAPLPSSGSGASSSVAVGSPPAAKPKRGKSPAAESDDEAAPSSGGGSEGEEEPAEPVAKGRGTAARERGSTSDEVCACAARDSA